MHRFVTRLNARPPATDERIAEFESVVGKKLPRDYVEFMKLTNGGEGFVGSSYLILWGIGEIVQMNKGYEVGNYAPGFLMFGSDGGGEAFGFDTRVPHWAVVQIPFIGMDWSSARLVAPSFLSFLDQLLRSK